MYFIVVCIRLYIFRLSLPLSLWCHTADAWEMQVSTFSPATEFEQYHATMRTSFSEQEDFVKDLL